MGKPADEAIIESQQEKFWSQPAANNAIDASLDSDINRDVNLPIGLPDVTGAGPSIESFWVHRTAGIADSKPGLGVATAPTPMLDESWMTLQSDQNAWPDDNEQAATESQDISMFLEEYS